MLYSLDTPKIFLVLLVGLLLAWLVHVAAQRLVQHLVPETKWYLQRRPGAAALIDPFATVAALLSPASVGWTPPVEWAAAHKGRKRPLVLLLLSGPVGNLVVGALGIVGVAAWTSKASVRAALDAWRESFLGSFVDLARVLGGRGTAGLLTADFAKTALFLLALEQLLVGVISLIPLPPLEGGRLLFLFTPKTVGWQKAEYNLAERNIGLIIVLACLIKIGGLTPPFAYLADVISRGLALVFS